MREDGLLIAEAAYASIDTDAVIRSNLVQSGSTLSAGNRTYDLSKYSRIKVLGFGKASGRAVQTIESILRERIHGGVAIDVRAGESEIVSIEKGTHPRPSSENIEATKKLLEMAKSPSEDELFIVVISGGGSSLFCWPMAECEQGARLYEDFKKVGATIGEMNTVRKHISEVKGGGLARLLYPADVIGLIFCDVPGDDYKTVASGPTYYDKSTIADAERVLDKYALKGYALSETPKDERYFEKVNNIRIVSNTVALDAMGAEASRLGYKVVNVGPSYYGHPKQLVETMFREIGPATAVIGGGEPTFEVRHSSGKGGRCQYTVLEAMKKLKEGDVFLALATDGRDNSDSAGAIADASTIQKLSEYSKTIEQQLESLDTYTFFEKTGDLLFTGPTDSNVSDLFVLLRR